MGSRGQSLSVFHTVSAALRKRVTLSKRMWSALWRLSPCFSQCGFHWPPPQQQKQTRFLIAAPWLPFWQHVSFPTTLASLQSHLEVWPYHIYNSSISGRSWGDVWLDLCLWGKGEKGLGVLPFTEANAVSLKSRLSPDAWVWKIISVYRGLHLNGAWQTQTDMHSPLV